MEYNNVNLVVGAGFSGAVIANLIATELNEDVLVIDKKDHIAGNCYDYRDKNGIMIHKYGSHIFHTKSEKVWKYLKQFTDFNTYMHKVVGILDGIETHIPFNFNTLYDVFPQTLAQRLEQKLFLHYTTKQWGVSPEEVDGAVTARVPVYLSKDNRYFQDKYQGIPLDGYTKVVERILNHKNIKVKLNTDYKDLKDKQFKRVFYTGPIDEFYNYKFGQLPYRSVYFKFETYDKEYYQSNACVNYPCNYDFTRIHEYKYYLDDKSDKTVIAKEYSEFFELGRNERYYPIPNDENTKLYEKYLEEAKKSENVYFLGRLGDYKYYDMDKAILRAIELFEEIK